MINSTTAIDLCKDPTHVREFLLAQPEDSKYHELTVDNCLFAKYFASQGLKVICWPDELLVVDGDTHVLEYPLKWMYEFEKEIMNVSEMKSPTRFDHDLIINNYLTRDEVLAVLDYYCNSDNIREGTHRHEFETYSSDD